MVQKARRKWMIAGGLIGAAAVVAAAAATALGPAGPPRPVATRADPAASAARFPGPAAFPAFPAFVRLPADQAAHPGLQNEWWYLAGQVKAGQHAFGYEVQIIARSNILGAGQPEIPPVVIISLTDVSTGRHFTKTFGYGPSQASFSATTLDARTPNATLSGPLNAMRLRASMPGETIDLSLDAQGPAIYDDGTGLVPFLGGSTRYYSLPDVATTGTVAENGRGYQVRGTSWLDHQWGNWTWADDKKWTWMGIHLSNGVSLGLWDIFSSGRENAYATVLEPDGDERVVRVTPLAPGTSGFVTSPVSGQRYGSQWLVSVPGLGASLRVIASPRLQEVQGLGGIDEAASTVAGTFAGASVTGQAQAEQFGNWRG